ncbi:electron transport complex protein RnfD|uniref:Ion-translocating oxidoreductase complex subunit D n=1 Tax=Brenneria salicis ATCC 15712 = DSM 30166 TaxID=714314 RepID=A0A366I4Q1_9GAMM|nr:electron transport complex subunit RsxD [Brenneria salicis]NMN91661.1 electron transport complex protein RnfD [Brenneria salicis ATCC 15712 = DSM 30166]RBP61426.1 electron transport complex protein RnfD [Brenneria salicis ATCC 15712 = DSM 30166]RLM30355.1 electron transport complex subunit RsxD [Brenneria salicis ATCC 15712 = DSM 30166]
MAFKIASSPFTHNQQRTQRIMLLVIIACIPGMLAQYYIFGYGNLIQVGLAAATALITETVTVSLRKFNARAALADNSALLTAILLGISLPPLAPWWMIVIGTAFAIVIAKQLYGGLGQNPFNPAMIGYVVLLISFPVQMTSWLPPGPLQVMPIGFYDSLIVILSGQTPSGHSVQQLMQTVDGVSQATPLDTFKTALRSGQQPQAIFQQPLFATTLFRSAMAGIGWQWVSIGFLIGGLFLLARGIIRWHIPVSFLLSLTLCAALSWWLAPEKYAPPVLHLLSGATMLGAFFIATDPVTASTTNQGRLIFGALIGLLVWLIRTYGGYPDGVAFAVLLANIAVPLIDYFTKPRAYGHHR